ncbi:MAG: hypothetical protein WCD45_07210, partial [Gallionella sp.]
MKKILFPLILFALICAQIAPVHAATLPAQSEEDAPVKPTTFLESEREKFASYRPHDVYSWNCIPGKLIASTEIEAAATTARHL